MEEEKVEKLTYTTKEVAQLLGVSEDVVQRLAREKVLRPLRISKRKLFFPKTEVERMMKDMISPTYVKIIAKEGE